MPKVASRDVLANAYELPPTIVTLDATGAIAVAPATPDWRTAPIAGTAVALEALKPPDPPIGRIAYPAGRAAKGRVPALPDRLHQRPLVIANPAASGRALAALLGATRGGTLAVAFGGKVDVLGVAFYDDTIFWRSDLRNVEVLVERSTVQVLAADEKKVLVRWDKPFDAAGIAGALAGYDDIAVLVGEGTTVQQLVDLVVVLRGKDFELGPMTASLAVEANDYRAKIADPPAHRFPIGDPVLGEAEGLAADDVNHVIGASRAAIRACYERELVAHPALEGTVKAYLTIDGTGHVPSAQVMGMDRAVTGCIEGVLERLVFPVPLGGMTTYVRDYPFVFHRRR